MSYLYGFTFQNSTTTFLSTVIGQFKQILSVAPSGYFGGTIQINLEYAGYATSTESTVLNLEGLIQFLYSKVYGTLIPTNPTATEKDQIYTVYDSLKLPRPNL
jgi:hypothetical protein